MHCRLHSGLISIIKGEASASYALRKVGISWAALLLLLPLPLSSCPVVRSFIQPRHKRLSLNGFSVCGGLAGLEAFSSVTGCRKGALTCFLSLPWQQFLVHTSKSIRGKWEHDATIQREPPAWAGVSALPLSKVSLTTRYIYHVIHLSRVPGFSWGRIVARKRIYLHNGSK